MRIAVFKDKCIVFSWVMILMLSISKRNIEIGKQQIYMYCTSVHVNHFKSDAKLIMGLDCKLHSQTGIEVK